MQVHAYTQYLNERKEKEDWNMNIMRPSSTKVKHVHPPLVYPPTVPQ